MSMSKRDYQAIARAIHRNREGVSENFIHDIADVLSADNPRFDRARFIEACETGAASAESCGRLKSTACDWDKGCRKHRN